MNRHSLLTLPAFGAVIPGQGGLFAAILRGPAIDGVEQPLYALLVSDATAGEFKSTWGEYGKDIADTSSRIDGRASTEAMALAECPAAVSVRKLTIDGHSDWYIPSRGELGAAAINVPELFSTEGYYWSSTQTSTHGAFIQDFESGGSYWFVKDNEHRVRACRAIPLELLNA